MMANATYVPAMPYPAIVVKFRKKCFFLTLSPA